MFRKIMYYMLRSLARISRMLVRFANRNSIRFINVDSNTQKEAVVRSTRYNMVTELDELFYGEQYWKIIEPYIKTLPTASSALDLGCSQGRFTVELGRLFVDGEVTACDISSGAIDFASNLAAESGLNNIDFRVQDISECLADFRPDTIDVAFMTEVTIFHPRWPQDFYTIENILKPGGLFVASFRSQYFNALCLVRNHNWDDVETVLSERSGKIFGHRMDFTWQTSAEIRSMFPREYNLEVLDICGIGVCSGIPGDPHDHICRPSLHAEFEQSKLMRLELELGKTIPDAGRYILVVARKPTL